MADKDGFDKVKYDSGYEKQQRDRRSRIHGYDPDERNMPVFPEPDDKFIERNNVHDRI